MEDPGARQEPHEKQAPKPPPDLSDQLSPNQALRDSLGASESQRVGDSGPVANPVVSFPDPAEPERPEAADEP